MKSFKDECGVWFELNEVCDVLSLSILEILYSPTKPYIPKGFLVMKENILYINSLGFLILAAYNRSIKMTIQMVKQCILNELKFWYGCELNMDRYKSVQSHCWSYINENST